MTVSKKKSVGGAIISLTALLSTFVFLYIGFVMHIWHPTWLIFISIPIVTTIVDTFTNKRPVIAFLSGIVSVGCVAAYLYMGFILNLWHPGWLIFFAIPILHIIIKLFTGECGESSSDTESEKKQEKTENEQ